MVENQDRFDCAFVAVVTKHIRLEIAEDVSEGVVPPQVSSFSELHDFVDANEYGGMCDADFWPSAWDLKDDATAERASNVANRIQNSVDHWLRSGGIARAQLSTEES